MKSEANLLKQGDVNLNLSQTYHRFVLSQFLEQSKNEDNETSISNVKLNGKP